MSDRLTDAELVARCQVYRDHGNNAARAAGFLGIPASTMRAAMNEARSRNLTADTKIVDEVGKLKVKLALAETQLKNIKRDNLDAEEVREAIYNLSARAPEPPKWLVKTGKNGFRGAPCTIWSDWHWGEVINPDEIGGVNAFNPEIGKARVKRLVNTTIDLCYNHMGKAKTTYPGMVICLGGDMMGGDIHEELAKTNARTTQQTINELTDVMGAAIDTMAGKFGNLYLPAVVGNHGRSTKKMQMKQRVYTSHEWNIYCNLERYFRKSKHIQFGIANEADSFFQMYNHRFMLTHGDSLGVKGGDGIIGAIGPIMRGSLKVHRSQGQIKKDFDTLLMCHWHQMLWLPGVIVNNSLKGFDEYAHLALRAIYSVPSQALFFVHPEHDITAKWEVFLEGKKEASAASEWVSFPKQEG